MKRIIFYIPFDQVYIGEQLFKCQEWSQYISRNKPDHRTFITWHNGNSWPEIERCTFANAAIYIRGHGRPGGDSITNDINGTTDVRYDELGIRLRQAGLNTMCMADIKFWNCSSGADSGPNIAFATRCANWLREAGYTRCKYYGYTQSISSYYVEGRGHKQAVGHRSGLLNWLLGRSGRSYYMGRASDYRVEV